MAASVPVPPDSAHRWNHPIRYPKLPPACHHRDVPAYLGGPARPELDAVLATGDLPGAARLAEQDARIDPAERQLVIGRCCSMSGRGEQAVAALSDSLEAALTLLPLPGCDILDVARPHADAERGRGIARALGEPNVEAEALADLGTAQVSRARGSARACNCWTRLQLARARLPAGSGTGADVAAAADAARSAHLVYDRLGAPAAVDSAALLTELGVPTRPRTRPAGATAALSDRERVVLDLLRDGLSNAEIAARQNHSVRTIEHHVSSILSKLGLRSRAEAAACAVSMEVSR